MKLQKEQYHTFYIIFTDGSVYVKTYDKPKTFNQMAGYHCKRIWNEFNERIYIVGGSATYMTAEEIKKEEGIK